MTLHPTGKPGAPPSGRPGLKSASLSNTNDKAFELIVARLTDGSRVLDLGCGHGHLARRIGAWFESRGVDAKDRMIATDLAADSFEASEIPFRKIDFNGPLPFEDASFDMIYTIEVTEHLHRPYDVLKECMRVLRPGGWLVGSTPNILNLQSRLRFLFTGFWDLYRPPSIDPANGGRVCGHVMPLHLAYYDYGLRLAGFGEVSYEADRLKRGSQVLRVLLAPLLAMMRVRLERQTRQYDQAVFEENREVLRLMNGPRFMASRSLMFIARRPV